MTHGCGTISSGGGGGGFSSGAASTSVVIGAHSSRRRRNSETSDEDCFALCWLIGFLFCIPKMTPKTRIVLTWIWVSTAAITTGVLVANNVFGDQSLSDSPWDMRKIDKLSSSFCSSVNVDSSSGMNTYLLTWSPPVITYQRREITKTYSSFIRYNSYEYWGFYFIEGSTVGLEISSPGSAYDFLVIKGKSNLDKWIDNSDCTGCYEESLVVYIGSSPYSTSFDFSETDQYYFLFANTHFVNTGSSIDVTFDLKRKYYDVTSGLMYCGNENTCAIDLVIGASFSIIIEAPKDSPNDIDVTVTCRPRSYLYVLIFGMIPALIGIGISLGINRYSKRRQTAASQRNRSDSRTRIFTVGADELGSVGSINYGVQPPSYVDKPPSYEESVDSAR